MKIHHVGYLTKRLSRAEKAFKAMGFVVEKPAKYDDIRKINIEFMINDGYRVELIEPVDKESPMYPLLKNYKNTPYHFCYIVQDIGQSIEELSEKGYHVIHAPERAPCIDDRLVSFLIHPDLGIVELVEFA